MLGIVRASSTILYRRVRRPVPVGHEGIGGVPFSSYCSFNCIYCPIDRKEDRHQTDEIQDLGDVTKALDDLGRRMEEERIEEVFLNGHGESLLHQALPRIIDFIHQKGAAVRLLSNGYLLHRPEYQALANRCEAVIGELKNAADAGFQKSQRPLSGYTLEQYTANMKAFRAQYHGRFIFEVTIMTMKKAWLFWNAS